MSDFHSLWQSTKLPWKGSPDIQDVYPMVLITGKPRDQLATGSDITRLLVDPYLSSWTALRDMQLPTNVQTIIDVAPACNAYGRGSDFPL